jgi:hypothetical protein
MTVINPFQALVHPQTEKTMLHGLSIPNPNFSEFAFFWYIDLQIRNCGFQSSKQLMS